MDPVTVKLTLLTTFHVYRQMSLTFVVDTKNTPATFYCHHIAELQVNIIDGR